MWTSLPKLNHWPKAARTRFNPPKYSSASAKWSSPCRAITINTRSTCSPTKTKPLTRRSHYDSSPRTTTTPHSQVPARRFQERSQTDLVPRLRGFRGRYRHHASVVSHRTSSARDRVHLRHWLFEPHPGLYDRVRVQHGARPLAADCPGHKTGPPRIVG